ncbi:MAG: 50S ribosomal protein L14e [Euryarchaeota archaeon]|nr:50S ribosomal protein L14e [Euryarchaeota archaeon]
MEVFEVGRVCVKLAGREAGRKAVVVEQIDKNFVLVDSPWIKRRRCNVKHLEPLDVVLKIKKGASKEEIEKALKEAGIEE